MAIKKVKTWRTPIADMNRSQLIKVAAWLYEGQDFYIPLGRGNFLRGFIIWNSECRASIKVKEMSVDYPKTMFDMQSFKLITDYNYVIAQLVKKTSALAKEESDVDVDLWWESFDHDVRKYRDR